MARLSPHYLRNDWTKILKFDWWVVIDVDCRIAKEFLFFYNFVNLSTAQNRLELGPQLPSAPYGMGHSSKTELNLTQFYTNPNFY